MFFIVAGCDPLEPGASGIVSLSDELTAPDEGVLHLALLYGALDDTSPELLLSSGTLQCPVTDQPVTVSDFPVEYQLCAQQLGVAPTLDFAVFAWLSGEVQPDGPLTGDLFGVTHYQATHCGAVCGIGRTCACDNTPGVFVELSSVAE